MEKYIVTGMSCAACSARVEKAVGSLSGVETVSVSLLTNSMTVQGSVDEDEIIKAVERAGYGIKREGTEKNSKEKEDDIERKETRKLLGRFIASLLFLILLMYISMGHIMWGWKLPEVIAQSPLLLAFMELMLTIIIMLINNKFFLSGFKGAINKAPNMDTLVALGSGASFVYSIYVFGKMLCEVKQTGVDYLVLNHHLHDLYFESAAMILTLITLGKTLESYSKGKTTDAIKSLMSLAPKTATVIRDGKELKIPLEEVKVGDIFTVKPGERVPVDGVVIEGHSALDESALTGESIPVDKKSGDWVYSATINQSGYLKCEANRVGEDTTLSQIIEMVRNTAATKAPIAKVADKVSGIFVPVVLGIAMVTFVVWLLFDRTIGFSLARGISVLVISCPCALGLATPVAIMVGNGVAAKKGILFKNATALEVTGKVKVVALDKTGTLTEGRPKVTDVYVEASGSTAEKEMLRLAYLLESQSEHPLAKAIVEYYEQLCGTDKGMVQEDHSVEDFKVYPGNGLAGIIEGKKVFAGNREFIEEHAKVSTSIKEKTQAYASQGKTPVYVVVNQELVGIIAIADVVKQDSREAIHLLQNMGVKVVMLTGDNQVTANAIGTQLGVDQVIAGVKPEGKDETIRQLKSQGLVAMVGDGINDAPALTQADVGMAIGAGTDIAIDAADVVLVKNSIMDVAVAIGLSRKVLKNIHENLFWAFIYNIIGIPLAAGLWYPIWGILLNPMFGAGAMSLSSFCVVTNALRLNMFKMKVKQGNKEGSNISGNIDISEANDLKEKGDKVMEKTMKIEGMMCGHCEARVKKTLEALPQVTEAIVSHTEGTAVVKLSESIDNQELKKVIEDQDYKVLEIIG